MGTENNCLTIKVEPFTNKGDNFVVKTVRKIEDSGIISKMLLPRNAFMRTRNVAGYDREII